MTLRRMLQAAALATAAVLCGSVSAQAGGGTPVPVEAFFKPAELQSAKLSPSGRYLAALKGNVAERVGFLIVDLTGKDGSHFVAASEKDDVNWFTWVTDDWLVFSVQDPNRKATYDIGSGLMSMSRDGKTSRQLVAREWEGLTDSPMRRVLSPAHEYVGLGAPGSLDVLVAQRLFDANYEYRDSRLHTLNVATGGTRVVSAPLADRWLTDGQGRARVAVYSKEGKTSVLWADPKTGEWIELQKSPTLSMQWTPLAIKDDTHLLVSISDASGYEEIREYDATTRTLAEKPLLSTPGFSDNVRPIYARQSDHLLGISVLVDSWTVTWLEPSLRKLQERIDAKLQGRVNVMSCGGTCVGAQRVLVHSYSDQEPGMTLLFTPETDEWKLVGRTRPDIETRRMASLELFRTKARDGEDLPVWITRPQGTTPQQKLPAVMLVHGGPWVRGVEWEWHAEAQFLASRGYLVIEPEFRGSDGYGVHHFKRGFKQWGLSMQDDLSDALKFAADQGWIDPQRVCIMGSSYGGYATLMGLIKDPDQYRCGIAFAAVSDPRFMFDFHWNDISRQAKAYGLKELLGDRHADNARFAATSPVELASRIKAPLMLVHGAKDRRVPIQNGERMHEAMQKANRPVDWVVYPWAAHGFPLLSDEVDFYKRVEAFLAKHLK